MFGFGIIFVIVGVVLIGLALWLVDRGRYPLAYMSALVSIVCMLTAGSLMIAATENKYCGTSSSVERLLYKGNQVYRVVQQERCGANYLLIVELVGSGDLLFVKTGYKLPSPEFSVVTFNGKTEILPSKDGKVTVALPLTDVAPTTESALSTTEIK